MWVPASPPAVESARQGLTGANTDVGSANAFSISGKLGEISEGWGGGDQAKHSNVTFVLREQLVFRLSSYVYKCASEQGATD